MKKSIIILISVVLLAACSSDSKKGKLIVNTSIDGLKVGKVYLQQLKDSTLTNVDSIEVDGNANFQLSATIDEPQIMYLFLDKKDGREFNDRILFFAEDTIMNITTKLEEFETAAIIEGSKNQDILNEYNINYDKLNAEYTALVKKSYELDRLEVQNTDSLLQLENDYAKHIKRKVGYALNYATLKKNHEVAPYILVKDAQEASTLYLDSVYKQMPKKIQSSRYGKQLSELIKSRKEL